MTDPHWKRPTAPIAVAVLATLAVSGCAPAPLPDPTFSSQPVEAPVETDAPEPEQTSGAPISAEEAAEINASWGRVVDDRAYQMPDGQFVLIKGGEPLPENVNQAVYGAVAPPTDVAFSTHVFNAANQEAMNAAIEAQEAATGRKAVVVIHGMGASPDGSSGTPMWGVAGGNDDYTGTSKEEALAAAQKWVDQSPSGRMIIVVDAVG
ncbi:MAG: hypothetical protein ACRDVF_01630 [Microbacterium sp.]|uniref:hypothetical protein n=1 Tax=Microbacterium sp. TaxID=51671 RepID=UPI003D701A56